MMTITATQRRIAITTVTISKVNSAGVGDAEIKHTLTYEVVLTML